MLLTKEMHLVHSMNFTIFRSSLFCEKIVRMLLVCLLILLCKIILEVQHKEIFKNTHTHTNIKLKIKND